MGYAASTGASGLELRLPRRVAEALRSLASREEVSVQPVDVASQRALAEEAAAAAAAKALAQAEEGSRRRDELLEHLAQAMEG